ncbi:MAG: dual specificity protein phosphatase [Litorilinea sp.]
MIRIARRIPGVRILADLPRLFARSFAALRRHGPIAAGQYLVDHMVRLSTGLPPVRYSRITPQLYVGGQYSRSGLEKLRARGFTSLINLREEFDDAEAGISLGRYLYLPTVDDHAPTMEDLREGVEFLYEEFARGGKVYVHCMLGVGRSVTLIAAYLVSRGMTPDEAWRLIRRRRPFIQPTEVQMALIEEWAVLQATHEMVDG